MVGCRSGMVIPLVEISSILCSISQSNPRGAAHERSGNSFRGGVSRRFTRRLRGQSTVEYVLIIAIIVLVVLIAGPWVSSAIGNQFNTVAGAIGSGTTGENFYKPVDIPDPQNGTAFAVYSEDDHSLMFYKRRGVPQVGDMFNYRRVTEVYTGFETEIYNLVETASDPYGSSTTPWVRRQWEIEKVDVVDSGISPKSIRVWFSNMINLQTIDASKLDTSNCRDMADAFFRAGKLKALNLSSWDVSKCYNFSCMFQDCWSLENINMRGWSARPGKNGVFGMFHGCSSLQCLDFSGFDMSSAGTANKMFSYCRSLSKVTLGSNWKWVIYDDGEGTNSYLPAPSSKYIAGADGKWYSVSTGKGYAPQDIPNNTDDTYVASKNLLVK